MSLATEKVRVNRSMMKRTYQEQGIKKASEFALANITDLEKVIEWNIKYNFLLYRMSSDMFPWMSEYELPDLPDYQEINEKLYRLGKMALGCNMRLTFHPGPFNVLASSNASVVNNTIKELRQHGEIMDMLNLPQSPHAKINIHIGGTYGNKEEALKTFIANYALLPDNVKTRVTVENDDKAQMYALKDLVQVHEKTGIPLVFDYFHHKFNTGGLTEEEAFRLSIRTWPKEITPVVHYSSSRKQHEDSTANPTSHADYIYDYINTYGHKVDIMLEAKAKEEAVIKYREQFSQGNLL